MKRSIFVAMVLLLIASHAGATPFLVCEPLEGASRYQISGSITATVPAEPDGSIHFDVSDTPVGTNKISIKACANHPSWPTEVCSDPSPFEWTRPTAPPAPKQLKLAP